MLGFSPIGSAPIGGDGAQSGLPPPLGTGAVPHYAGATIMRVGVTRGTTTLGPDRLQQTLDFP
jgi:hypothetical protein